ncbi:MAG: Rab family GTPase [Thermoplasmata archaeon]
MAGLEEIKKKIILLGDGGVGKTSLIKRFVVDKFEDDYLLTVGFKITVKDLEITVDRKVHYLRLQIWDILGQKGYIELHKSSLPGTAGVLLVADVTKKATLQSLETYWIPNVQSIVGPVPFVVMANKFDLMEDAEFREDELRKFADKYDLPFYLTSAKNGENVKNAFHALGERMLEFHGKEAPKPLKIGGIEFEKNEFIELLDKIIVDFSEEYGRPVDAMPVLRRQFEMAKLDINNPTIEALRAVIERLADIEKGFKRSGLVEANRLKRLRWIKEMKQEGIEPP